MTLATRPDALRELRRELDTADAAYQAYAMRDTSSLSADERADAAIDRDLAHRRRMAAADAYHRALDEYEGRE